MSIKIVEIIEANAYSDHVHMLISIPPKYSVLQIMGYFKGKSNLMKFDHHANLKDKYGNRVVSEPEGIPSIPKGGIKSN